MTDRPILFSGPMVKAIRDGRKTQTRRPVKLPGNAFGNDPSVMVPHCPYGQPGNKLWVRETHYRQGKWVRNGKTATGRVRWRFKADPDGGVEYAERNQLPKPNTRTTHGWHKRPAIFMPRWASRITLEVTGVRVERLQDISEADAKAEGIRTDHLPADDHQPDCICYVAEPDDNHAYVTARAAFTKTWDNINAKRAPWASNPHVWAIEFKRLTPNPSRR